jgi:hypothetical protein
MKMIVAESNTCSQELTSGRSVYGGPQSPFAVAVERRTASYDDCDMLKEETCPCAGSMSRHLVKKRVSFSNVHVREHSLVIGDHPCCEMLPLSLGWGHLPEAVYDLNEFERHSSLLSNNSFTSSSSSSFSLSNVDEEDDMFADGNCQGPARKLSYIERKLRLKTVSGLSETDLMRLERHRRMKAIQARHKGKQQHRC